MSRLGNRRAYRAVTHAARRVREQTGQPPALNAVGGLASHGSQAPHVGRRPGGRSPGDTWRPRTNSPGEGRSGPPSWPKRGGLPGGPAVRGRLAREDTWYHRTCPATGGGPGTVPQGIRPRAHAPPSRGLARGYG